MTDRLEAARNVLRTNDRGGYTVPTARLYPFQWNWDSAFVAMGFASFDAPRGWQEIDRLLEGQWEDGLIPQIVFHAPSDDYFPGPDVWGVDRTPPTSGITQPPVLATAAAHLLAADPDRRAAEARMAEIYPRLLANHRWWAIARDPHTTGLVSILHPWETGMDNSPAWDDAMARIPTTTTTEIRRRDTSHIDPAMRPRAEDYQRFVHLVDHFRATGWNPAAMFTTSPLRILDVGVNSILLRAERDLLALAPRFGTAMDTPEIAARITRMQSGLATLWHAPSSLFRSRDAISNSLVPVSTSAGFLPLYADAATPAQADAMAATLHRWQARVQALVPSTDPDDPAYEPLRYWRGPIWAVVNWMIADGFARAGREPQARAVREDTNALIAASGFAEYFSPQDRSGAGGGQFSWTAAIALLLHDAV